MRGFSLLEGGDGRLWGDVLVKAHLFARLYPIGRESVFSDLEDAITFATDDLKTVPLPERHLVASPNIPGDVPREL